MNDEDKYVLLIVLGFAGLSQSSVDIVGNLKSILQWGCPLLVYGFIMVIMTLIVLDHFAKNFDDEDCRPPINNRQGELNLFNVPPMGFYARTHGPMRDCTATQTVAETTNDHPVHGPHPERPFQGPDPDDCFMGRLNPRGNPFEPRQFQREQPQPIPKGSFLFGQCQGQGKPRLQPNLPNNTNHFNHFNQPVPAVVNIINCCDPDRHGRHFPGSNSNPSYPSIPKSTSDIDLVRLGSFGAPSKPQSTPSPRIPPGENVRQLGRTTQSGFGRTNLPSSTQTPGFSPLRFGVPTNYGAGQNFGGSGATFGAPGSGSGAPLGFVRPSSPVLTTGGFGTSQKYFGAPDFGTPGALVLPFGTDSNRHRMEPRSNPNTGFGAGLIENKNNFGKSGNWIKEDRKEMAPFFSTPNGGTAQRSPLNGSRSGRDFFDKCGMFLGLK